MLRLYVSLMVVSNKTGKNQKNMAQTRHSCTPSGRKQPQEPCDSTSAPSPSLMERGQGGEAHYNPACTARRVLRTTGSYRHHTQRREKRSRIW